MPFAISKDNKLIVKNNKFIQPNPNPSKSVIGFQAFDGSNRYFKRLALYDLDCCFIDYPPLGLQHGRKDNPAISNPDDGYYIIEKEIDCCCHTGRCIVVESVRWYGKVWPVGTIVPCPTKTATISAPVRYVAPPNPLPAEYIFDPALTVFPGIIPSPLNTPTFGIGKTDANCCNADGSKTYFQLSNEIL